MSEAAAYARVRPHDVRSAITAGQICAVHAHPALGGWLLLADEVAEWASTKEAVRLSD